MKSDYIKNLEKNGTEQILITLKKILSNIINNIDDPTYKKLKMSNINIKNIVNGNHVDILYKAGFIKKIIDFEEYLIFNYTNINFCKLKDMYNELNDTLFHFNKEDIKDITDWDNIKKDCKKRDDYHKKLITQAEEDRLAKLEYEQSKNNKLKIQQLEKKLHILEQQEKVRHMTRGYLNYLEKLNK